MAEGGERVPSQRILMANEALLEKESHFEKKDILVADHLQINKLADTKHCFREGENNCRIINNKSVLFL